MTARRAPGVPARDAPVKTLSLTFNAGGAIEGATLEERARLVLLTLGKTPAEIRRAYRRMAKRHHPDAGGGGSTERFQVLNEAYAVLAKGRVPRRPLLADDALLARVLGRRMARLIDRQKEWERYDRWSKNRFYGVGVV